MNGWSKIWPPALGVLVVGSVGAPAAIASYMHARTVVARHDTAMSPWLPLSVDGLLVASLVVMWVRRHRHQPVGVGPWSAFIFGLVTTVAANIAAVQTPSIEAYVVALFPPLALAIALELVALIVYRSDSKAQMSTKEVEDAEKVSGVPVITSDDRGHLRTFLYKLYGSEDQLLYVGITFGVPGRLRDHRDKLWWPEVVRCEVATYANRFDALAAEREAIQTEKPAYNKIAGTSSDFVSGPRLAEHDTADIVPIEPLREYPLPDRDPKPSSDQPHPHSRCRLSDEEIAEQVSAWPSDPTKPDISRVAIQREFNIGVSRATRVLRHVRSETSPLATAAA